MPITKETIDQMTDEQRQQFIQEAEAELKNRQIQTSPVGRFAGGLKRMGIGALKALPHALRDEAMPEEKDTAADIETYIAKEKAKRELLPKTSSERLADIELEEIKRRRRGVPTRMVDTTAVVEEPSDVGTGKGETEQPSGVQMEREMPSQYITVMKWKTDKYGNEYQEPTTTINPNYTKALELKEFKTKEEEKILNKIKADQAVMKQNFGKVSALMENLVSRWKAAAKEKEGIPLQEKTGLSSMLVGGVIRKFHLTGKPHTTAYPGQRIETAMAMSRIITGGARVIRSVINKLMETLPEDDAIVENMQQKVAQTLTNAYRLSIGRTLTPEEEAMIDAEVERILQTPPAREAVTTRPIKEKSEDKRNLYNQLREEGYSAEEAKRKLGL